MRPPRQRALIGWIVAHACTAQASLIAHDFSDAADNAPLLNTGGGSGFTGNWGATTGVNASTSRIKYDADLNLSYSGGGYAIAQTGTGLAYGDFDQFRGINRPSDPDVGGTVWFSILVQSVSATYHAGIQFNSHADLPYTGFDYTRGSFDAGIRTNQLEVRYNGVTTSDLAPLSAGQTHLLLGRIIFQDNGVNDRLDLWADPADVQALGTPLFSAANGDLGTQLFLPGVFAYGAANSPSARLDALRISDGNGNAATAYFEVTGVVPEPGTLALGLLGACLLARRRGLCRAGR